MSLTVKCTWNLYVTERSHITWFDYSDLFRLRMVSIMVYIYSLFFYSSIGFNSLYLSVCFFGLWWLIALSYKSTLDYGTTVGSPWYPIPTVYVYISNPGSEITYTLLFRSQNPVCPRSYGIIPKTCFVSRNFLTGYLCLV